MDNIDYTAIISLAFYVILQSLLSEHTSISAENNSRGDVNSLYKTTLTNAKPFNASDLKLLNSEALEYSQDMLVVYGRSRSYSTAMGCSKYIIIRRHQPYTQ
jgi:hypothetical protein